MSGKILQVNFNFKVSAEDYIEAVAPLANDVASVPGLQWKVWLVNKDSGEAGGVYWFENAESLQSYLDGPIVAGVASHPALENISVKVFDSIAHLTEITRGPVEALAAA